MAAPWSCCPRRHQRLQPEVFLGQQIQETPGASNAITTPSSGTTETINGQQGDLKVYVPRKFSYIELAQATANFNEERKLGQGAFGVVYDGRLEGIDGSVAIKEILETFSEQTKKAFDVEVQIMSQLHHRNILSLKGWCKEDQHLLLIYEKVENGNLEDHLYPKNGAMDSGVYTERENGTCLSSHLSWLTRCNIIIGIASGLAYLHKECQATVVHRDLKPANVMLDKNWNAKLADFGLVTQLRRTQTSRPTDNVIGTLSYMDPAYMNTGKVSEHCDVYSFGVVLLEIVCGKRPSIMQGSDNTRKNSLIEMVRECQGRNRIIDAADKGLRGQYDNKIKDVLRLGLECVHSDRRDRPHAVRVRDRLNDLVPNGKGLAASTSQSEGEFGTCRITFPTHSLADEEAGVSPLLSR
ncbi:hypothetical protein CFC21_085710 [Triticum aestivum]|uniref:Protein kinase domain-containing protein n=2 Tax=Triticum aestivum TaxID=4565 RepID=A0A3B6PDZ4_WHEAT|nr:L-type lectin-domain containing receptor kinase IX.1-like [Triticum aestivum]KAF7081803.1 hypothetical protein CFC21_085710 [Triticum aestivum]